MDAVEIFKELHTSKKKGMTDVVKETVVSAYISLLVGIEYMCEFMLIIVAGWD